MLLTWFLFGLFTTFPYVLGRNPCVATRSLDLAFPLYQYSIPTVQGLGIIP